MGVKTIAVIGAGAMGRGIAYASALGGYRIILEDVSAPLLEQGLAGIREALDRGVAARKLTPAQKQQALARLTTAHNVEDACRAADLIIETLPDEMEMKLEIFTILDRFAKPGVILASNTSSLSITELAAITFRPEACAGMRFGPSVADTLQIEIVRGLATSDATIDTCAEVARRMGKEIVIVNESPQAALKSA